MASKTIDWEDGSGDKITLTYAEASGNQDVTITSDANKGYVERSKDITVSVSDGSVKRTATINQAGKDIVIITRNDVASTDNSVAVGYE